MGALSWGVDGFGRRHYVCNYCELVFGVIDPSEVDHECDKSKPRYHNKDKHAESGKASGRCKGEGLEKARILRNTTRA